MSESPDKRNYSMSRAAVTAAAVATVWCGLHFWNANDHPPTAFGLGRELVAAVIFCFPMIAWLRRVSGKRAALSIGEWLGITLAAYAWLQLLAAGLFPDGGRVALGIFIGFAWVFVGMLLCTVVLLFGLLVGLKRSIPYKLNDTLGIALTVAAAIIAFIELRMNPLL